MDKLKILLDSLKTPAKPVMSTSLNTAALDQNKARARELLLRMQIQLAKSTPLKS